MHHAALFVLTPQMNQTFWASYLAWCAMEIWIFSRDTRRAAGEKKDRGSVFLIILTISIGLTAAFYAPHLWPWAAIPLPAAPMFQTAIGMIWFGIVLRLWAVFTLGKHFRTAVKILDGHKLVTHGPYRVLRHPSYTGGLITVTGVGLAFGNWISLAAAFFGIFIGYAVRILVEEKALREAFGEEFERHRKRTWAVIPGVW